MSEQFDQRYKGKKRINPSWETETPEGFDLVKTCLWEIKIDTRNDRGGPGRASMWTKVWRRKIHGMFPGKRGSVLMEKNIPGGRKEEI